METILTFAADVFLGACGAWLAWYTMDTVALVIHCRVWK